MFIYKIIHCKTGIKIVTNENGTYSWTIESSEEFGSPLQALRDAQKALSKTSNRVKKTKKTREYGIEDTLAIDDLDWYPIVDKVGVNIRKI